MLKVHDVIQVRPEADRVFGGAFGVVDEVKEWGVIALMTAPGEAGCQYAPVRLATGDFERIGPAVWVLGDEPEEAPKGPEEAPGDVGRRAPDTAIADSLLDFYLDHEAHVPESITCFNFRPNTEEEG